MIFDDYDGQMIFRDLMSLKLPDIRLIGEEKSRKNLTQETCPDWGSNSGPLRDMHACCHFLRDHLFGIVVSTSGCHPRGPGFDSRLYSRNFYGSIGFGTG